MVHIIQDSHTDYCYRKGDKGFSRSSCAERFLTFSAQYSLLSCSCDDSCRIKMNITLSCVSSHTCMEVFCKPYRRWPIKCFLIAKITFNFFKFFLRKIFFQQSLLKITSNELLHKV